MTRRTRWFIGLFLIVGCHTELNDEPFESQPAMTLEQQLGSLSDLGLKLNQGVTVGDLLISRDRTEYEEKPFDAILFILGSEIERQPWGRPVCDKVWNFDLECIEGNGSYVKVVNRLLRVSATPDAITGIEDFVDFESGKAWLKYTIGGQARHYSIAVDNDWADSATVDAVMHDIERDGKRFYAKDNGQALLLFYLDHDTANQLNQLTGDALQPVR